MPKKTPRQKAVAAADKAFSEYIRARDKECYTCGATEDLQCGHLITRSRYATRWDERNAKAQCRGCNYQHEYRAEIFTDLYISDYGARAYHELVKKSKTAEKISTATIQQIAIDFRYKRKELEARECD